MSNERVSRAGNGYDLSVIIVSYNVKYFLEQCLYSVYKALQKVSGEVIVVDNNSYDDSARMIRERFPQVRIVHNQENLGFARANNQAIRLAAGRYILLLNPDTVVQEDTFSCCLEYMESHIGVGCMGVKMIDGKGKFLPESKRALPTPVTAFYKIFGLSALFPRSKRFGRYHLGYLDQEEIHEVDVISGAYMLIRRAALEKTGLLDEDFFMYGEDIDLSYRLKLAGFINIYFPRTTIIHYKGESTRKGSYNYVVVFYRAMIIFARKHFSKNVFRMYAVFIHLAIYLRAGLSILRRFVLEAVTPILDALIIYAGFYFLLRVWENQYFGQPDYYPQTYLGIVVPSYVLIWLFSIFLSTGYEKRVKATDLARGVLIGSLIILIIYALLPESLRYSRAMILIGTCWVLCSTISVRYLLSMIHQSPFSVEFNKRKRRIIIIGGPKESDRVYSIVKQAQVRPELLGFVDPEDGLLKSGYLGHIEQIEDIVRINQADELIFCAADISSQQIIRTMLHFTDSGIAFKIAPPESISVIGSNAIDGGGELYVLHFNTLSRILNRRKKRLFDILLSFVFIAITPVWLLLVRKPAGMIRNIVYVLAGFSSWVGYYRSTGGDHPGLPEIKPGILSPYDLQKGMDVAKPDDEQVNLSYAKDYRVMHDLQIILRGFTNLGRNPAVPINTNSGIDKKTTWPDLK